MRGSRTAHVLAIFLIMSQFFLLLIRPFPILMDDWYHLSTIRAFYERRSVQLWDDWEFAPWGRPHLYPPLFHAVAAALGLIINAVFATGAQGSILRAFLFLKAVSYPLLLFSVWWLSKKLFPAENKAALYSLLLVMSVFSVFFAAEAIVPSAFALALLNFLAGAFIEKRKPASVLLLASIAYTHIGVFLLAQLLLLIFSTLKKRDYFGQFLLVGSASLVIYGPWLLHVLLNAGWFRSVQQAFGFSLPVAVLASGLAGAKIALEKRTDGYIILLAYLAALLPSLFWYGHRFWIYAVLPLSLLGGVAIAKVEHGAKAALIWLVLLASLWYAPTLYSEESITYQFSPDAATGGFLVESPLSVELTKLGAPDSPLSLEEREMAAWIGTNTGKDETIMASDFKADMIYSLTGRKASGGAWFEMVPAWLLEKSREYDAGASGIVICEPPCHPDSELVAKIGRFDVRKRG